MDFNTHSMKAHFHDLERQVKPKLSDYQPRKSTMAPVLRVVSVVGAIIAVGLFLPLT
jgi:hypothetical protein